MREGDVAVSRRDFVKAAGALGLAAGAAAAAQAKEPEEVTDIGSRRELFVEMTLISQMSGGGQLRLHRPVPQEVSLVCDMPWEGASCAYMKVFQDGELYRMYYRGSDVRRAE